jgi:DNA-binding LacI/PurR family transcriptional regulator
MSTTNNVHTIADVARLAGVSKSTVSRALNDSSLISSETKERVRAIAREHGFQMNVPARRLSLKRSHTVALVTYAYDPSATVPDVFMLEMMSGISAALHANDYDLLVVQSTPNDVDYARRYLETGRTDGFIALSAMCSPRQLKALTELGAPFVIWGPAPANRSYSSVSGDSVTGGRLATEHLLRTGRRRIGFLGGPAKASEVRDRLAGYEAALRDAGQSLDDGLIVHADWDHPDITGAAALEQLLERAPDIDGVFANSDLFAMTAMDTLRGSGRRVPDDVAVVGYDDIAIARHSDPPLTTIRQDGPLAGRLLAQNLLQQIETGAVTNVSIPAELVVRRSA